MTIEAARQVVGHARRVNAAEKPMNGAEYTSAAPPHDDDAGDDFSGWPDGSISGMFDTDPPKVQWRFHERLLADRGHLLTGIGGSSKTRVLYHLAQGAVLGSLPWEWPVCATGSAALFLTEDVAAQVHRVIHQMGQRLKPAERKMLEERLRVYPLAGKRALLLKLNGNALHLTSAYGWLMSQVDKLPKPVAFVGIDPALGITEGDEMNPAHQRRLGELIDHIAIETGACGVLSSHAAKAIQGAEELASHSSRGNGAITDAVRGEFTVRNMTSDEARRFGITDPAERRQYVQMQGTKGNELPPEAFVPIWLRRGIGGELKQVSLSEVERGTVGPRELHALELLRATAPQGDTTLRFWRARCVDAGIVAANASEPAQEKAMQRIRDALLDAGMVAKGSIRGSWVPT